MNKKGFELAIRTIVIIVLSILVLITLLVIWNAQTGIFSEFLKNLRGETNVDNVVLACNSLKSQEAVYEYCCVEKNVKYQKEGEIQEEKFTCDILRTKNFTSDRIQELNCEEAGCEDEI